MSAATSTSPSQQEEIAAVPRGAWGALRTPLRTTEVVDVLRTLSRQGKLPGFHADSAASANSTSQPGTPDGPCICTFEAFGAPIDHTISVHASADAPPHTLTFVPRAHRKVPVFFFITALVSVWPGLPLTDSMIRSYFPSYSIPTWWWYLPLTVLPLPFMAMKSWRTSRVAAYAHTQETLALLAPLLHAQPGAGELV